jgi:RNA polymerase sigma-70 factor (ECF subfamily)
MSVSEMQQGAQCFAELLTDEVYQLAWRFCCSLAGDEADAQDLLQEALYQGLRCIRQLREPAAFRSWLLAIVRRRFLNLVRQRRAAQSGPAGLVAYAGEAELATGAAVTDALHRLPEEQRSLLTLFYFEGFSMRELGRSLGVSPLVVQGRLARARDALRRRLLAADPELAAQLQRGESHG